VNVSENLRCAASGSCAKDILASFWLFVCFLRGRGICLYVCSSYLQELNVDTCVNSILPAANKTSDTQILNPDPCPSYKASEPLTRQCRWRTNLCRPERWQGRERWRRVRPADLRQSGQRTSIWTCWWKTGGCESRGWWPWLTTMAPSWCSEPTTAPCSTHPPYLTGYSTHFARSAAVAAKPPSSQAKCRAAPRR